MAETPAALFESKRMRPATRPEGQGEMGRGGYEILPSNLGSTTGGSGGALANMQVTQKNMLPS